MWPWTRCRRTSIASLSDIQWVVSAYLLALAAVIPLTAWAGRRFGAYRVYMVALILFTLGSALCGLATSTSQLIAFRALQGIGGGLLMPIGMTLLVKAAGRENLPTVMSAIGVPMVLAPVFGPTLGGLLLQSVSWHAIFWINVPIGIATAVGGDAAAAPSPAGARARPVRLDWPGLLLAGVGHRRGHLRAVTERHRRAASPRRWSSAPSFGASAAHRSVCCAAAARQTSPPGSEAVPVRAYSAASVVMFFLGAALFGAMILLPLYFQVARGEDAIRTGLLLIPQALGSSIGMNRSAVATHRFGAGLTSLCGVIIMVCATIPFLFVSDRRPTLLDRHAMVIRGIGRRPGH